MKFQGIVIKESLADRSVLDDIEIISTNVEAVTERHKTPWLKQWTLHTLEVPEEKAAEVADKFSRALDKDHHNWFVDFNNEAEHFIIFADKVFHIVDRADKQQYDEATEYGVSIGVPDRQVDFSPYVKQWER